MNFLKKDADDRRDEIIEAAGILMNRKGYRGISTQEIADRGGIDKSTLFYYYKNKEEILLSVMKRGTLLA
jgi:AcrR family transcriptional regulator